MKEPLVRRGQSPVRPLAPPVYRPHATPVQRKGGRTDGAPPVYRVAPAIQKAPAPFRPGSPAVLQPALSTVAPIAAGVVAGGLLAVAASATAPIIIGTALAGGAVGAGYRYFVPGTPTPPVPVTPPVTTAPVIPSLPSASPIVRPASNSAPARPAALDAAEANRRKQLADVAARKQAEKQKKDEAESRKLALDNARREANRKKNEDDSVRAAENQRLREQRAAADLARKSAIDAVAGVFAANGLNAPKSHDIAAEEKARPQGTADTARVKLQAALDAQLIPAVERWRFKLDMNAYVIRHTNRAGVPFPTLDGDPVHITLDSDSIAAAIGSIAGRNAPDLVRSLLSTPVREFRIHATQENTVPANHYYYGDIVGVGRADKQHLRNVLENYIASDLVPRAQDAINQHGDI